MAHAAIYIREAVRRWEGKNRRGEICRFLCVEMVGEVDAQKRIPTSRDRFDGVVAGGAGGGPGGGWGGVGGGGEGGGLKKTAGGVGADNAGVVPTVVWVWLGGGGQAAGIKKPAGAVLPVFVCGEDRIRTCGTV